MKKGSSKKTSKQEKSENTNGDKKELTLDDTITSYTDESIPRRYRNPISQRWDDTTWT